MNINLIIGAVVGLVVVVGGGYLAYTHQPSQTVSTETQATSTATTESGAFTGTLFDLAKRGGTYTCTIDSKTDTAGGKTATSGTVHVSGMNVRGDFTSTVQGMGNIESHMIADGTNVYTWNSMLPQGFKMKMTATEDHSDAVSGQGSNANQSYTYDCQPGTADASLFVPPAAITFTAI
jgi:hypothetical protein